MGDLSVRELRDADYCDCVGDIGRMQARKIADRVYGMDRVFFNCLANSLNFYGWKLDGRVSCWVKGGDKVALSAVMDVYPQDCGFADGFIDHKVLSVALLALQYATTLRRRGRDGI